MELLSEGDIIEWSWHDQGRSKGDDVQVDKLNKLTKANNATWSIFHATVQRRSILNQPSYYFPNGHPGSHQIEHISTPILALMSQAKYI
jgi:hypothetical protein